MLTNMLDENVYKNALELVKNNEIENEVNNLMVSLNGINKAFETEEPVTDQVDNVSNVEDVNVEVEKAELNEDEIKWIEGALSLQNKNAYEKNEFENLKAVNESFTNQLNGIYVELETLNTARQDALEKFDIAEVVKIDAKINDLQILYKNKVKELDNYKADIKKQEDGYKTKLKELEDTLTGVNFTGNEIKINKEYFGNRVLNEFKNNKILDTVKSFLSNYSKEERKTILQNSPELIKSLGENYNELLRENA